MDPDAMNVAGFGGTGGGGMPARTAAQRARDFLRTEAFYVAVAILVIVLGGLKTWSEFRAEEEQERTGQPPEIAAPNPLLQKDLDSNSKRYLSWALTRTEAEPRHAAAFAEGVATLNRYLLFGGAAVALVMGFSWALRGHHIAPTIAIHPPWGLWDVFKLAALWAAAAQLFHTKFFFHMNPEKPYVTPGDWVAEIFIALLLAGAAIHIVVAERGGRLGDLGIRKKFLGGVGIGLAAFLVLQPFIQLVTLLEERAARDGWIPDIPVQRVLQVILETRSAWVLALAAVVAVVVAPISEELLFRGLLQPALGRWVGRWPAILFSAAFFAVAHMDLYAVATLLVLGIALGYVYDRTKSLAAPIALHMAFNGITLLSVFAFRGLVTAALNATQ